MKSKKYRYILSVVLFLVGIFSLSFTLRSNPKSVLAEESSTTFFFDQLNSTSKKIYNAIDQMEESGNLKKGNYDYSLNNVFSSSELDALGQTGLLMAFGAA